MGVAQSKPAPLDSQLAEIIQKFDVPGMAALALFDGKVVQSGVAGVRARGSAEKINIKDRFHLGSCTKAMTATLCAQLVAEKKLSWTTTCGEVFATIAPGMDPSWKNVTLENLLTNRSGAPGELNADDLWGDLWRFKGSPSDARLTLVRGVLKHPPLAAPGEKYIYSNAGFSIAGAMAEVITKTPWEDLLQKRIFKPLGMASAGFGAPGVAGEITEPRGHQAGGKVMEPGPRADNPVAIGPAGIVNCSITDWAKFIQEHLDGETGSAAAPKLLTKEDYKKLHSPAPGPGEKYAMGWVVTNRSWAGGRTLNHNGSNTMWYCVAWLAPERNLAVIVTCNIGGDKAAAACDAAASLMIRNFPPAGATSRPGAPARSK